jgi:hypothetical protein
LKNGKKSLSLYIISHKNNYQASLYLKSNFHPPQ